MQIQMRPVLWFYGDAGLRSLFAVGNHVLVHFRFLEDKVFPVSSLGCKVSM